ncbi:hypothetical protein [Povalibacter sp.]|uniref:DUF883 family protein n=1 Tax=Povalibacter sp. TaxID=1962978 RepID=UPI002F3F93B4
MSTSSIHPTPDPDKFSGGPGRSNEPATEQRYAPTTLLDIADAGEDWVRANPWGALVAAAGIGFLFGLIMSRGESQRPWER